MDYCLIDLDGTIINSMVGVTTSVQYALRHHNIIIEDLGELKKHIGPPIRDGFMEFYGFSEEQADEAVKIYREFYKEKGLHMNELYEGMESLLKDLKNAGKKLIVATSKPEVYAKEILKSFNLLEYFTSVCGATLDGSRADKTAVMQYAIEKNEIGDLSKVVMIGDTKFDIEGSKNIGVTSIGVLYGFGTLEDLEAEGADYIVKSVKELRNLLIK